MKKIYFYYFVALLFWFSLYTYPAYLPIHIQSVVHDLSLTGAILSMYGLVQIFIRLPLGIASDALGKRKPFIILGLIALGVGPIILAKSNTASGLFIGRAITGFAAGTWVPLSAHIIDKSSKDIFDTTNTLSFIGNLASILAVFVAPLLTLTRFGIESTFWIASFSALITIVVWVLSSKGLKVKKIRPCLFVQFGMKSKIHQSYFLAFYLHSFNSEFSLQLLRLFPCREENFNYLKANLIFCWFFILLSQL